MEMETEMWWTCGAAVLYSTSQNVLFSSRDSMQKRNIYNFTDIIFVKSENHWLILKFHVNSVTTEQTGDARMHAY